MLPVGIHISEITDSGTVPMTGPIAADIETGPNDTPVARPVVGPTVAMAGDPDVQIAVVVTFCVVPSEYVPIAVSWVVLPNPA